MIPIWSNLTHKLSIYIDTDIDECENTTSNDCKQVCINTEGSYYCECLTGFKLIAGSTTDCEGEIKTFLIQCT